jgi:hypothetical protein
MICIIESKRKYTDNDNIKFHLYAHICFIDLSRLNDVLFILYNHIQDTFVHYKSN